MTSESNLAVVGAGLVGRRHLDAIALAAGVRLSAIVDPAPAARTEAEARGVAHFTTLDEMLASARPDGVILATPNALHEDQALACIAARLPVLVEKPLATGLGAADRIVSAARAAGVPLATGHHRRHNPLIRAAKARIEVGEIGQIVAVQAQCWLYKPDDYFSTDWRRQPGAGPVFINLIHDIDLMRHLAGEIVSVQAMESSARRGHAVEDTAVVLLRFAGGALGTVTVSDTIVAPWSWELTAGENPAYPQTPESCYQIGGSEGSLSLPDGARWHHEGAKSWWRPISATRAPRAGEDPLVAQARQFGAVVRGEEAPLVSGQDGRMALAVIEAVKRATTSGREEPVA
jgi:predicted dehydrogenase